MARYLDELEDDNPIEEDYENNSNECLYCGELISDEKTFCSRRCRMNYDGMKESED